MLELKTETNTCLKLFEFHLASEKFSCQNNQEQNPEKQSETKSDKSKTGNRKQISEQIRNKLPLEVWRVGWAVGTTHPPLDLLREILNAIF